MDKDIFKKRLVNKKTSSTISNFLLKKLKEASLIEYITLISFCCVVLGCANLIFYCIGNRVPFPFSLPTISYSIIFVITVFVATLFLALIFFLSLFLGKQIWEFITQLSKNNSIGSQAKTISIIILPYTLATIATITVEAFEICSSIYTLIPIIPIIIATIFYVIKRSPREHIKKQVGFLFFINFVICLWAAFALCFIIVITISLTETNIYLIYSISVAATIAFIYINIIDANKAIIQKDKSAKLSRYPIQHIFFAAYTAIAVFVMTFIPNGITLTVLGHGGNTIARYELNSQALPEKFFDTKGPTYTTKPIKLKSDLASDFVYIKSINDDKNEIVYSFPKSSVISYEILSRSILRKENSNKENQDNKKTTDKSKAAANKTK
ncbi:MAG: hypothetical protein D6B28_10885 [Gammaproteobacteria bacterium]|nr:MAG: hypothetical protein D6B28_10885 [Gammaproteobacteria bacterium]